jgi:hypothetical protein
MTAGFAVVAAAGVSGLPAVVVGGMLFSLGLAPVYVLTIDLVVSTVRPERAGMAARSPRPELNWGALLASLFWVRSGWPATGTA